jgi:hypothetical protein
VITRIDVARWIFAVAVIATCSVFVANVAFAQTTTRTSPSWEHMADPLVEKESSAQSAAPQEEARVDEIAKSASYVPPTARERLKWTVDGTVGSASIAAGVFIASWNTAWDLPSEWDRNWSGFAKRLGTRKAQAAISNGIEAGLSAAWGEDPRYFPSGRGGIWARTGHAAKGVLVAHHRNGELRPAWARYVGAIGSDIVANTWLPASDRSALDGARRIANGFLGRLVGNLWMEFWPDVRRKFAKRD